MPRNIIGSPDHGLSFKQWRVIENCIRLSLTTHSVNSGNEDIMMSINEFTNHDLTIRYIIEQVLNIRRKTIILLNRLNILHLRYEVNKTNSNNRNLLFNSNALICINAEWRSWCNADRNEISQPDIGRVCTRTFNRHLTLESTSIIPSEIISSILPCKFNKFTF